MIISNRIIKQGNGYFCIRCNQAGVERFYKKDRTFYRCPACRQIAPRCIVIDDQITWRRDSDGTYWHKSVGVIVFNQHGQILCIQRKIFPFALALPAGHLDTGELPEHAAQRELHEETGINKCKLRAVATFDMPGDSCRRGSDHHRWHLYMTNIDDTSATVTNDEASNILWADTEILLRRTDLSYALRFILREFDMSALRNRTKLTSKIDA